ncbi:MAG TPA: S-layer homology domain-containing protein [Thermoanaerobaculia bacterium]|nr:S-layer homology domain-containing protein [Thermoanaerobaculia bacterium]
MRTTRPLCLGVMLFSFSVGMSAQLSSIVQDPKASDFGPSNLTHVRVTAMEFVPLNSADAGEWKSGVGFTRYPTASGSDWGAALHLPGGAFLKRYEVDYCDTSVVGHLKVTLWECDNQGQNCTQIIFGSSTGNGCSFVAADNVNHRIDNYHHLYVLDAIFDAVDGTVQLASVILSYQLEVSPAPGTPTFGDVPTSDPAFQYIEALSASGITAGCAGGNYCPDAPLTRRQMAVFLAKALGLQWTNF